VRDKNKVRYTGSTLVKFIITEGKPPNDTKEEGTIKIDTLTSRQKTETKIFLLSFIL